MRIEFLKYCYTLLIFALCISFNNKWAVAQTNATTDSLSLVILKNVQDSLKFDDNVFNQLNDLTTRYNNQKIEINNRKFSDLQNKQKLLQNLNKNRRIEISDILSRNEVRKFIQLYQKEAKNVQTAFSNSKKLSEKESKDLGKAIREYQNRNVFKTIASKRVKLDNLLLENEKNKIKTLINELASIQKSIKEKKIACNKIKSKGKEKLKCRQGLKNIAKQKDTTTATLKNIIDSFKKDEEKAKIFNDLNNDYKKWEYDLKMLIAPYYQIKDTANFPVNISKYISYGKALQFLLLKPEMALKTLNNYAENDERKNSLNNQERLQISNNGLIDFEITQNGLVNIAIFDNAGQTVDILINEEKTIGNYSTKITNTLKEGVFYVRLHDEAGEVIKKYVHLN